MSTIWENTDGCAKQYICDLAIHFITMLSSSCGIIIYLEINALSHGKNFYGLNATDKHYLKERMEPIDKLASNDTSNIGMLTSASKYVFVKFEDQCIQFINNKDI